jgi:hypothetical protein
MAKVVEHRRGQRMAAAMWVRLSSSGAEIGMGHLANASISGAFLETAIKLPLNSTITLEPISSAGAAIEDVKFAARVARVDPRGLGLEWRVMATPESLAFLGVAAPDLLAKGDAPRM